MTEQIDPLEISFSNDKGFEPSTPSQGSASSQKNKEAENRITTPFQLFDHVASSQKNKYCINIPRHQMKVQNNFERKSQSMGKRIESPRNFYAKMYETNYFSNRKNYKNTGLGHFQLFPQSSFMHNSMLLGARVQDRKRATLQRWERVDAVSHLNELSRLNELIDKVNTHVNLHRRMYPLKGK